MMCTCSVGSDHPTHRDEHEEGCGKQATVLVFRNASTEQPVAVPQAVVLEAERPYRAYQLMLGGYTWAQIAAAESYADARAAHYDVQSYLAEARNVVTEFSRREQLQLEIARLNELQAAVWGQALKGHLPAVRQATDLIITRTKLLGLAELGDADSDSSIPRTVIVPQDESGYTEALERAVDG